MTGYQAPYEQKFGSDLAALMLRVAMLERQVAHLVGGAVPVTSSTHPTNPTVGMEIFETDTNNTLIWDGTLWRVIQTGGWTPYTPVWTASGTAPNLGSGGGAGSLVGAYSKVGRMVNVHIGLFGGTSTTWGTGSYSITLPFTANIISVPSGQFAHVGTILASNAGNTTFYSLGALIDQSTPGIVNGIVNGSGVFWGQGSPATWGTTAQAAISLTYESVN